MKIANRSKSLIALRNEKGEQVKMPPGATVDIGADKVLRQKLDRYMRAGFCEEVKGARRAPKADRKDAGE